jgi:hypothetical protein
VGSRISMNIAILMKINVGSLPQLVTADEYLLEIYEYARIP